MGLSFKVAGFLGSERLVMLLVCLMMILSIVLFTSPKQGSGIVSEFIKAVACSEMTMSVYPAMEIRLSECLDFGELAKYPHCLESF